MTRRRIFCHLFARGCGFKESNFLQKQNKELRRTGLDDLDTPKQRKPEQEKLWGKRPLNSKTSPQKRRREAGDGQRGMWTTIQNKKMPHMEGGEATDFWKEKGGDRSTASISLWCPQQRASGLFHKACGTCWAAKARRRWVCGGEGAPGLQKRRGVGWGRGAA